MRINRAACVAMRRPSAHQVCCSRSSWQCCWGFLAGSKPGISGSAACAACQVRQISSALPDPVHRADKGRRAGTAGGVAGAGRPTEPRALRADLGCIVINEREPGRLASKPPLTIRSYRLWAPARCYLVRLNPHPRRCAPGYQGQRRTSGTKGSCDTTTHPGRRVRRHRQLSVRR